MKTTAFLIVKNANQHIETSVGIVRSVLPNARVNILDCLSRDGTMAQAMRLGVGLFYTSYATRDDQLQEALRLARHHMKAADADDRAVIVFADQAPTWLEDVPENVLSDLLASDFGVLTADEAIRPAVGLLARLTGRREQAQCAAMVVSPAMLKVVSPRFSSHATDMMAILARDAGLLAMAWPPVPQLSVLSRLVRRVCGPSCCGPGHLSPK